MNLGLALRRLACFALMAASGHVLAEERVITLAPHVTELVFAAGAGASIVATVNSSDYPPAARILPRVGDGLNVNVEQVLALRPTVVIAWQPSGGALTLAPTLAALHIPLLYSEPRRLDDIPLAITRLGDALGTQAAARPAAQALAARINALREHYAGRKPVLVFLELGPEPLYTIGKDPLLNDVLQICGARNLYADSRIAAPQVSIESLLVQQPDVVIVPATDPARVEQRTKIWAAMGLRAARQQHIYGIDPDELFRPGPRLIDAAETLCRLVDLARWQQTDSK